MSNFGRNVTADHPPVQRSAGFDYHIAIANQQKYVGNKHEITHKGEEKMKKLQKLYAKLGTGMMAAAASTTVAMATTTGSNVGTAINDGVVTPVTDLIKSLLSPAVALVVAVGMVYCVILGVKYAKCEEPQEREKAKGALKNAIIGFILIFVLMIALIVLTPTLKSWVNSTVLNNSTVSSGGAVFTDIT